VDHSKRPAVLKVSSSIISREMVFNSRKEKIMSKLVILTDTGTFKAFRLEENGHASSPRLEPLKSFEMMSGDDRISRYLSDKEGQRTKGSVSSASINDSGNGERHNIWLENRRRSVREIAETMSDLLADSNIDGCYFAAGNEINHAIVEHLSPNLRAKIEKNVHCNLVNATRDDLLAHFYH